MFVLCTVRVQEFTPTGLGCNLAAKPLFLKNASTVLKAFCEHCGPRQGASRTSSNNKRLSALPKDAVTFLYFLANYLNKIRQDPSFILADKRRGVSCVRPTANQHLESLVLHSCGQIRGCPLRCHLEGILLGVEHITHYQNCSIAEDS